MTYEVKMCYYRNKSVIEGAAYYRIKAKSESDAKMQAFLMAITDRPDMQAYAGEVVRLEEMKIGA